MRKETKKPRKLTLNRETLRNLTAKDLSAVYGGEKGSGPVGCDSVKIPNQLDVCKSKTGD